MVSFLDQKYLKICDSPSTVNYCYTCLEENYIIAVVDKKQIIVKQDDKMFRQWAILKGQEITAPVVYDAKRKRIIAIFNKQIVRNWNIDDLQCESNWKKLTSTKAINCCITSNCEEPIILFEDGGIQTLKKLKEGPIHNSQCIEPGEKIERLECQKIGENVYSILFLQTIEGQKKAIIRVVSWKKMELHVGRPVNVDISGTAMDYCSYVSKNQLLILSIDDSGQCKVYSMEGAQTKLPLLNQINPKATNINIRPLNNVYAAVLYVSDGLSFIGALHTMFGNMTSTVMNEFFESPKLFISGDKIIASSQTSLAQIRFEIEYGLLVDAIGKTKPNFATVRALWGNSTELYKIDQINFLSMQQCEVLDDKEINSTLENLINNRNVKQIEKLIKKLEKVSPKALKSHSLLLNTLRHLLSIEGYWPAVFFRSLVEKEIFPSSLSVESIRSAAVSDDILFIRRFFETMRYIPEDALVIGIQTLLSLNETVLEESLNDIEDKYNSPIGPYKAYLINNILQHDFNGKNLMALLKQMELEEMKSLLEHLRFMLEMNSLTNKKLRSDKIIEWINLCIDSYSSTLILSPTMHVLLIDLHDCVAEHKKLLRTMCDIDILVNHMQTRICKKLSTENYSIFNLHIP
ncbi:DgyrCDS227 [Dimorphilus gyrociliatus]|uniref:DgyrCDS227 n=1 Tax=Dimorphilus gyrociliatus TaxID=2664684 RepID=A0A7I8V3X9_9ANNE|nr:DgyrCDS227 [Dimorphilus gyrociliatus]